MPSNIAGLLEFYRLATQLKHLIRSGWIHWNVKKERLESVAEHIYGALILAISIDSQFSCDVDLNKVLKILTIHELKEIIIGDITCFQGVSAQEKRQRGRLAVEEILSHLIKKEEYFDLIQDFEERDTKEAKFAYLCDKLECDLQAKSYEDMDCMDLQDQHDNPVLLNARVQEIIESGTTKISDIFYHYDRPKYINSEIFTSILDYAYGIDKE